MAWVDALRHPDDITLIKTFFSAFKETNLDQILADRGITSLYFAGLLSNMCVLATSLTAVRLVVQGRQKWEVKVITDALAWRREQSHSKALQTLEEGGVQLITSKTLIGHEIAASSTFETSV